MPTTINKSYSSDFGSSLTVGQLRKEINDDGTVSTSTLQKITKHGDDVDITFQDPLSGGQLTQLDVIIAAHTSATDPNICIESIGTYGTTAKLQFSHTLNRTVTVPDATTTLIGTDTSDSLTNKSFADDVNINSTTQSVDGTTGALIVDGGVGIAKNLNIGGNINEITGNELGYLSGVTSGIQTQIDGKAASSHYHDTSDINTGTFADARIAASNVTQHEGSITIGNLTGAPSGSVVGTTDTQTLTNKTLTLPQINDTSSDHQYVFGVSELTADRTVTMPLLTSNDEFTFNSHTQTLTNKTIDADNNTITNIENADIKAGAAIDASKIADGSVTSTEFQYINTVTSNVQTQLNGKASSSHTHNASDINAGTLADARITASNVTQHEGSITIGNLTGAPSGAVVGVSDTQTLTNKTLTNPIINQITTNGTEEILKFTDVGTAVNEFTISNSIASSNPILETTGTDSSIGMTFLTKGGASYDFQPGSSSATQVKLFQNPGTAEADVTLTVSGSVTTDKTVYLPNATGDLVVDTATQTLTNKTIAAGSNTITGLANTDVGLGNVQNLKVKLDATTAPVSTNDTGEGYAVGSIWVDVTGNKAYVCVDSTASSAIWTETTSQGELDHTNLTNIGTNTHAQIDTHIASTANPHSVTIDQVTPTTTKGDLIVENGSNAIRLAVGTDGYALVADSAQSEGIKWAQTPTPFDMPVLQVRRTTTHSCTTGYDDLTFDTTDVENNTNILEHNDVSADNLDLQQTGVYLVSYQLTYDDTGSNTLDCQVRLNNTTVINGSKTQITSSTSSDDHNVTNSFVVSVTGGDFITLQVQATAGTILAGATMSVVRLLGSKGNTGATGSGSDINFKNEGSLITNTPHSAIDIIGPGIAVTDHGDGTADITLTESGLTLDNIGGTLSVSKGGSGTTTHTSGNFLQGNGTSAVTATKAVPSGDVIGTTDTQTLTNKTFTDSTTYFQDNSDNTKKMQFELSSISTTSTILLTVPDGNTTLVGTDLTQTLTNKTFDADGTGNILSNVDNANIKAGAAIDATKIADGSVTSAEFQYINTVTSNVQTQIDGKSSTSHTHDWDDATGTADVIPLNIGAGAPAHAEGKVFYDAGEHTLAVYNDQSSVTHQLGQEGYIRVYNNSGSAIVDGKPVYVSGTEGVEDRPTIALAKSNSKNTSQVIGVTTQTINNNSFGYITSWGLINGLDTSSFSSGDTLYVDETTAGSLRNTAPPIGNYKIQIGFVIKSHASTGRILASIHQDLVSASGDASEVIINVQKGSAGTLNNGDVVHITGYDITDDVPEVELADASSSATMPAFAIMRDSCTDTASGIAVIEGTLLDQDTSSWSVGDSLYISETSGTLTNVKPTGTALIQKMAIVSKSHASTGILQIFGAGRSNDLPNLPNNNVWVGNGSGVPTETATNTGFNLALGTSAGTVLEGDHSTTASGIHGVSGSIVGTTDTQTLTNKTLTDSTTYLQDDADNTKKVQFQLSGITTATTRTLTIPDGDTTLVGTDTTQTLTNKTITSVLIDVDNLRLDANTLSSTNTNGDISIIPDGTGEVLLKADPVSALGATTKQYVDNVAVGLTDHKESVRVKTVAALPAYTQSGAGVGATLTADANGAMPTVDGITLVVNNRVLVTTEATTSDVHNGIYDLTQVGDGSNPWILTRSTDADEDGEVTAGLHVFIEEGSTCDNCGFVLSTNSPVTVDTTAINFVQFTGTGNITAGDGINKTNNTLDVDLKTNGGLVIEGTQIAVDLGGSAITGTLTVADGGTGATTHTSGNFLVGAGSSAVTSAKAAPTGTVVGTTDTQTLSGKTLTLPQINDTSSDHQYIFGVSELTADRTVTLPLLTGNDEFVFKDFAQTLTNKTLTTPVISSISNSGTVTIPSGTDTLVGRATTDTLTNKTLTAPIISTISNTGTITLPTSTDTLVGRATTDTLTNKTLTTPIISSISNTGTITLPTSTDTLVGRTTTDTLTNKTLTSAVLTTPQINDTSSDHQYVFGVSELVADRTVTLPLLTGNDEFTFNDHSQTLTNKTLTAPIISSISNSGTLTLPTSTDTLVGRATTDTLTNKTLTTPIISSISNTGTLTLPTSTDTLVGRATTDTLTNKTLTTPVISSISNGGTLTLPSGTDTLVGKATTDTLTNKSLSDSTTYFTDNVDNTKKAQFECSGIATSTTRTFTLPNANTTLVGTDTTQTLTNKTITSVLLDVDNLRMDSNTISSTDTNGDINLTPNGTGEVVLKANPTVNLGASTKQYTDSVAAGLYLKKAVRVRTIAALPAYTQAGTGIGATLTADANGAMPTVDGVTLTTNDRVLVDTPGSTSDIHNGIYDLTQVGDGSNPWILTRSTDADANAEVTSGMTVIIDEGDTCTACMFVLTTPDTITVDTTALDFQQLYTAASGSITASNTGVGGVGVFKTKTGNDFKFKNINAGSSKVTVTNDAGNDEIDVDVSEANLTLANMIGAPTGTVVGTNDTQTLSNKTLTAPQINDTSSDHQYIFGVSELTADRTVTLPLLTGNDEFVFKDFAQTLTNKTLTTPIISSISNTGTLTLPTSTDTLVGRATTDTLTNKTLTLPQINDTSSDHQYIFGVSELTLDRTVTLPLLTGNDTFVFASHTETLNNKTITSTSNTVTAKSLHSATTSIDVVSATAPTSGQVLTATSGTAATWQTPSRGVTYVNVTATSTTTTTSGTYTQINTMTNTPASGTYWVTFSASGSHSSTNTNSNYAIYSGGTKSSVSERNFGWNGGAHVNDFELSMHSQAIVTVNGSQAIEVRWHNGTSGTFTCHERSMVLLKL